MAGFFCLSWLAVISDYDLTGGDRLPPQNVEAEEEILGGILLDPDALVRVSELLRPEMFYTSAHQEIYRAALQLHSQGQPTDLMTVSAWLADHHLLERVGGTGAIRRLLEQTVSSINIDQYARLVLDKYMRRQLIQVSNTLARLAYDTSQPLPQVMDQAEQQVFGLTQERVQRSLIPASEVLVNIFSDLEEKFQSGAQIPGIPTKFIDLDNLTQGLQRSDLLILAGRPSMGKTSLALNVAQNVAAYSKQPVAVFSLEMSREQLVQRLLASEARIDSSRLRSGRISENEWQRLGQAIGFLSQLPLFIDDTPDCTVTEIRSKARRLQAEQGGTLGMVLIDYLQLMQGSASDNRVQELSRITRGLKALAKELMVPVVVLSQLSRAVESRSDKRPQLADLRESGCLAGETEVLDVDRGKVWRLEQLASVAQPEALPRLLSLNSRGRLVPQKPVKVFCSGEQRTCALKTRLNLSIQATGNHPFFTQQGWKVLDDLQLEEEVAVVLQEELVWDPVVSISELGDPQPVYDIEMPRHHNFVANGLLVHNSIEQDADLVMMLYRPEYYDPNTSDRGIAEVIIAKHRNGPTGTVRLLFENQYTQFRNLADPNR
ncbi:replicative DNA helicase [Synechococcus sp. Nb3U1]|uniref:replicative DNA helicase n=1 Tax=Synechococcus sp. Nb3U1 TaxID=1914529 RepID=UPI003FCDE1AC